MRSQHIFYRKSEGNNRDKVDGPIKWEKIVNFFKLDQMHGLHIEEFH